MEGGQTYLIYIRHAICAADVYRYVPPPYRSGSEAETPIVSPRPDSPSVKPPSRRDEINESTPSSSSSSCRRRCSCHHAASHSATMSSSMSSVPVTLKYTISICEISLHQVVEHVVVAKQAALSNYQPVNSDTNKIRNKQNIDLNSIVVKVMHIVKQNAKV